MRTVLLLPCFLLPGVFMSGCAHAPDAPAYPVDWRQPMLSADCTLPVGEFANQGSSSDPKFPAPPLASILFEDKLAGFPVESIDISHNPASNRLILRGILAGVPLKQYTTMVITDGGCEQSWGGETHSGTVNATLRTEALLYTGGLLLPLSEKYKFHLQLLQDGALLVRLDISAKVMGGLIFPLSFSSGYWLRYGRYPLQSSTQAVEEAGRDR